MEKTLRLVFVTDNNKNYTLSIADPIEPVISEDVQTAMNTLINNNVLNTKNGALVGIKSATLVTRTVNEIELV